VTPSDTDIKEEKEAKAGTFEDGFGDGYDHQAKPLPPWMSKPVVLKMLTARQRGFLVGYWTYLSDRTDHA
jgi:hypothetical protein